MVTRAGVQDDTQDRRKPTACEKKNRTITTWKYLLYSENISWENVFENLHVASCCHCEIYLQYCYQ